jgi:hypothetical protein
MSKAAELAALIGSGQAQGDKNLIINGAATVHQRGNQTASNGSAVYFVDRWNMYHNSGALAANLQQSTVVPSGQGFNNSILVDCTTVDSSVGAAEVALLRQIIEGQNLQRLAYGSSGAKSLTISFWVRSTKTGIYVVDIYHADATARTQSHQYTISQADTWEYKTLTFSGDTSIATDNDNAATFYVQWVLMSGTDHTSGSLATTWQNQTDVNRFVGQVNFFDSTSNNFYLTGVQMEVGDVATAFEHEDFGTTLAKCQRYYQRIQCDTAYDSIMDGMHYVTTQFYAMHTFPVQMRGVPTMGEDGSISVMSNGADRTPSSFILNRATKEVIQTYCELSGGNVGTAGHAGHIRNNNDADQFVEFKAEL